jgi:hypothetical protein
MNIEIPKLHNGQNLNSFLKVEPQVAFGSFGALCSQCHKPLSPVEYVSISFIDKKGWRQAFGYLTDKHICKRVGDKNEEVV